MASVRYAYSEGVILRQVDQVRYEVYRGGGLWETYAGVSRDWSFNATLLSEEEAAEHLERFDQMHPVSQK